MPRRSNTIWAVFTTDSWHTQASRKLIGTAINLRGAISCINHEQRTDGLKPLNKEQLGLLHSIHQTQSSPDLIDGEYLLEKVRVWDDTDE